jgi:para-nitrobenzyl esterase
MRVALRPVIISIAAFAVLLATLSASRFRVGATALLASPASAPLATVAGGQIRGALLEEGGAVFKGIPFAKAPVAALRWREPQRVDPWNGVRETTSYGSACAQNANGRMLENSSEDCLFLNVWTPDWPATLRKPVMVWIHGGGNYAGTASGINFDGERLARHGVVLVTTNYRLNAFGFFAHPDLTRESPHHASGNYGLMDQIAALEWVRDNIARFGGDPANVTIFGQSAGAVDVDVLMTSPRAKGLFHRAIAESGTVTRNPDAGTLAMTALGAVMTVKAGNVTYSDAPLLAEAERRGVEVATALAAPPSGRLAYLRSLPAADLLKVVAAPRMAIGPANGVVVDGWTLPEAPADVYIAGRQTPVPILIGNNARERTPPQTTVKDLVEAAEAMYGPLGARANALYHFTDVETTKVDSLYGGPAAQWVVDTMYRCPVVAQIVWHAAHGQAAYEYEFERSAPGRETLGAVHGAEVPYVFGTIRPGGNSPAYTAADRELSEAIQHYWTNFAKNGTPNGGTLPQWARFDAKERQYLAFTDTGPAPRAGLRRAFCDLYLDNVTRLRTH